MLRAPQSAFCAEEQSSSLWLRVRVYACACACVGWLGHFCTAWGVQPEIAAAVALGEFERMDDLVAMRTAVGLAFMTAIEGCSWLKPQKVLEGCVSSWYTVGLLIERPDVAWLEFRRKFVEMGGDGFCESAKIARTLVLQSCRAAVSWCAVWVQTHHLPRCTGSLSSIYLSVQLRRIRSVTHIG